MMHKTYLYILDSYKKLVPVLFIDYAFRVCQPNRQQVSSSHRLETQPIFLMGENRPQTIPGDCGNVGRH